MIISKLLFRAFYNKNSMTETFGVGQIPNAYYFNSCPDLKVTIFSGLVDKKGNKIYEGDKLKMFYNEKEYWKVFFGQYESLYDEEYISGNGFFISKRDRILPLVNQIAKKCEVVGNIYEKN